MMKQSVFGLDVGSQTSYVSLVENGGVETVANDYSQRDTPSVVALGQRQRFLGVSAKNQQLLNLANTAGHFKNMLGRRFDEQYVKERTADVGAEVVATDTGAVGFKMNDTVYSAEQVMAMLLAKLKETVVANNSSPLGTCVLSAPAYFTEGQREALKRAAKIARLDISQIMDDTNAVALAYGRTRDDLPDDQEDARNVAFVDLGASGLQAFIASFSKSGCEILGTVTADFGGTDFDRLLAQHLAGLVKDKYEADVTDNKKAMAKLRTAAEKAKKQMSVNSNVVHVSLESFVNDTDVQLPVDRTSFESLIAHYTDQLKTKLQELLELTKLDKQQVEFVEIVGGSTRIPCVKRAIEEVFGKPVSTSLNADEAVSRGCAYLAATLSGKFLVKSFQINECVVHGVEAVNTRGNMGGAVVYNPGDRRGKQTVTVEGDLPMKLALQYTGTVAASSKVICLYEVAGYTAEAASVQLGFNIKSDGSVALTDAKLGLKQKKLKTDENNDLMSEMDVSESETEPKDVELTVTKLSLKDVTDEKLQEWIQQEEALAMADLEERRRQEAINDLEEQLLKYKNQLAEVDENLRSEEAYTTVVGFLEKLEEWLYDEEDVSRSVIVDTLKNMNAKLKVFDIWKQKYYQMKAKEEEQKREKQMRQEQSARSPRGGSGYYREIPIERMFGASRPGMRFAMEDPFYHSMPSQRVPFRRSMFGNDMFW